jgi:hypothetical protein
MTTDERLAKVEGQLARMKCRYRLLLAAVVMMVLVMIGTVAISTGTGRREQAVNEAVPRIGATGTGNIIEAEGLILAGEDGKKGVVMSGDGEPTLTMFDKNQIPRLMLSVAGGASGVTLYDRNGKKRIELGDLKGEPILRLYRDNGTEAWDRRPNDSGQRPSEDGVENLKTRLLLLQTGQDGNEKEIQDLERRLRLLQTGHDGSDKEIQDLKERLRLLQPGQDGNDREIHDLKEEWRAIKGRVVDLEDKLRGR